MSLVVSPDRQVEAGSFRDPDSRVVYDGPDVLRAVSARGLDDFRALEATPLLASLTQERTLVKTELLPDDQARPIIDALASESTDEQHWEAVLRHERLPFISYPYEWSFAMLRDAALLQLELLLEALDHGLMIKDATPYNVQWHGAQPVFIDVGSFERLRDGEPWAGYRQFCMQYLYPLLLQAWRGVDFQPLLRGSLEGLAPQQMRRLLTRRDVLRRGAFAHVFMHSRLESRYADRPSTLTSELRRAGFQAELIRANVRKLIKLVRSLEWQAAESGWTSYGTTNSYSDGERVQKEEFVRQACSSQQWNLVWDIGCNDGSYSRIAADSGSYVVALDSDHATLDHLYRMLHREGNRQILPLVADVADPSPGLGWRGAERKPLGGRGEPDLVLCLAVIHHVVMTSNVPIEQFVHWLAQLGAAVVIEFPTKADAMVRRLLERKRDGAHPEYELEHFERLLGDSFEVRRHTELDGGTRHLFFATPRS